MKSQPSYLFLLFLAVLLFGSCHRELPTYLYEATGMSLSNADNAGEAPVPDVDSVPRVAYALQLNLMMSMTEESDEYYGYHRQEDVVNEFSITSPNSFNGVPAYESLNHFFSYYSNVGVGDPVSATGIFTGLFTGNSGYNGSSTWNETKYLLLMEPPVAGDYTFFVRAGFNDGHVLADTITVKLY